MSDNFKKSLIIIIEIIMGIVFLVYLIVKNELGLEAISFMVLGIYFLTGGIHKLLNLIKRRSDNL